MSTNESQNPQPPVPVFLGIDPGRPPPAPRNLVAIDFNRWREDVVLWEYIEQLAREEQARGTCDLVAGPLKRRHAVPGSPPTAKRYSGGRPRDLTDPVEQAKAILASQRVATWGSLDEMSEDQIRVALADLEKRLRTRSAIRDADETEDQAAQRMRP
jgi:hypothetical protein